MCTIHQPSSKLFAMFHKVMFLTDGRISYVGSPDEAVSFFSRNGFHCPKTYNPADFIIGILSRTTMTTTTTTSDMDGNSIASQLCNAFEASCRKRAPLKTSATTTTAAIEEDRKYDRKKPFWICTVFWMLQRNWLIAKRDPSIQNLRIIQKFVSFYSFFVRKIPHFK